MVPGNAAWETSRMALVPVVFVCYILPQSLVLSARRKGGEGRGAVGKEIDRKVRICLVFVPRGKRRRIRPGCLVHYSVPLSAFPSIICDGPPFLFACVSLPSSLSLHPHASFLSSL
jgi:hypothetical protein